VADPDVDPHDPGGHVLQGRFGLNQIGHPGPAERLLQEVGDGKIKNGYELQMLLMINYDLNYGIFNHDDDNLNDLQPLALVQMHEKEKVEPHTMLYRMMMRFGKYKVSQHTGMSWPEFVQQPRDVCEHWFNVCKELETKQGPSAATDKAVRDLTAQLDGKG